MKPLLSIIIPSFNYARFLPTALDSILNQDFKNFEIILQDDGSTDDSHAISKAYAAKDPRIKYTRHEKNRGLFILTEEGIQEAQGKYLHFFGADDLYLPGFLSKFMHQFMKNPDLGLVCCNIGYFQDGSSNIDFKTLLQKESPVFYSAPEVIDLFRETDFWVPGAASIARKDLVLRFQGQLPVLENLADWYLYHQIALYEGLVYIPENLIAMRVHEQTYTRQVKRNKKRRRATYWALLKLLEKNPETKKRFKESALLTFVFNDLSWRLRLNPKYWNFLPYINQKKQLKKS